MTVASGWKGHPDLLVSRHGTWYSNSPYPRSKDLFGTAGVNPFNWNNWGRRKISMKGQTQGGRGLAHHTKVVEEEALTPWPPRGPRPSGETRRRRDPAQHRQTHVQPPPVRYEPNEQAYWLHQTNISIHIPHNPSQVCKMVGSEETWLELEPLIN